MTEAQFDKIIDAIERLIIAVERQTERMPFKPSERIWRWTWRRWRYILEEGK